MALAVARALASGSVKVFRPFQTAAELATLFSYDAVKRLAWELANLFSSSDLAMAFLPSRQESFSFLVKPWLTAWVMVSASGISFSSRSQRLFSFSDAVSALGSRKF